MANGKRLIDANKVPYHKSGFPKGDGFDSGLDWAFREDIDKLPTVDAVEVVHGRWIEHSHLEVGGECSVCGWQFQWFENNEAHYCPHCGAKMDGDEDG